MIRELESGNPQDILDGILPKPVLTTELAARIHEEAEFLDPEIKIGALILFSEGRRERLSRSFGRFGQKEKEIIVRLGETPKHWADFLIGCEQAERDAITRALWRVSGARYTQIGNLNRTIGEVVDSEIGQATANKSQAFFTLAFGKAPEATA